MDEPSFVDTRLVDVVDWILGRLDDGSESVSFRVLDPDVAPRAYPGERLTLGQSSGIHRPLRTWVDLAERLRLRLKTPSVLEGTPRTIRLTFERLDESARPWRPHEPADERYGARSDFQRISRLDDPYFVLDLRDAVARIDLPAQARILDLGVNAGREIELLQRVGVPEDARWVGIDHSGSAIEAARRRFTGERFVFHVGDVGSLDDLALGRFELIVSLGTLQSPGIDDREVLRRLVQRHLADAGSMIVGFPNGQFVDGQPLYGARTVNVTQPELSLLVKTLAFYKKYLQQHRMRVFITGKDDVFVTGVGHPIR